MVSLRAAAFYIPATTSHQGAAMQAKPKPKPPYAPEAGPRLGPRLIEVATRRAHDLRDQAIDDALRQFGRWLRRPFPKRPWTIAQEQPCHS
jgi:hypothetical protein